MEEVATIGSVALDDSEWVGEEECGSCPKLLVPTLVTAVPGGGRIPSETVMTTEVVSVSAKVLYSFGEGLVPVSGPVLQTSEVLIRPEVSSEATDPGDVERLPGDAKERGEVEVMAGEGTGGCTGLGSFPEEALASDALSGPPLGSMVTSECGNPSDTGTWIPAWEAKVDVAPLCLAAMGGLVWVVMTISVIFPVEVSDGIVE